jgi:hypothetical protein
MSESQEVARIERVDSAAAGFVVQLEPDVWLGPGIGDPARSCVLNGADIFWTRESAGRALIKARGYGRPFANGLVLPVNLELATSSRAERGRRDGDHREERAPETYGPIARSVLLEMVGERMHDEGDLISALVALADRLDAVRDTLKGDESETARRIRDALSEPEEGTEAES